MKHPDVRYAMASRTWGLRRIRRLTWGIAGAGAAGAVVLAFGFGNQAHQSQTGQAVRGGQAQVPAGSQNQAGSQQAQQGGEQLQPPQGNPLPAAGPGQVVSGGS